MGSEESGDRVLQQRGGGSSSLNSGMVGTNSVSDKVSGVTMCSESMFYGSNWDPIMSLSQTGNFGNSNMVSHSEFANPLMLENQTMGSSLVQFPSDSGLVDLVPRIPTFGSGSFSEMVTSFGHNADLNHHHKKGVSQDHCPSSDNGMLGASPYGKRKREVPQGGASSPKVAFLLVSVCVCVFLTISHQYNVFFTPL